MQIHKLVRRRKVNLRDDIDFLNLRYQFFSAIAGAITEAKIAENKEAILVFHTYLTSKIDHNKLEVNNKHISNFIKYMGLDNHNLENGIYGPLELNSVSEVENFEIYFDDSVDIYIGFKETLIE